MHLGGNLCWVPLTCDNCKKSFPENRSLVSYLKTFHEQLSFNCNKIVFRIIQQTWRRCSKSSWNIILRTMPTAIITEFSFSEEAEEGEQQETPRLKQARRDDGIHEELWNKPGLAGKCLVPPGLLKEMGQREISKEKGSKTGRTLYFIA